MMLSSARRILISAPVVTGCASRGGLASLGWRAETAQLPVPHPPAPSQHRRTFGSIPSGVEQRLQRSVGPGVASLLQTQGFAVVDGLLGEAFAAQLRSEILELKDTHLFHLNSTHLVKDGQTHMLEKQNIWEAEGMAEDVQEAASGFSSLQKDSTLMTMLTLHLPHLSLSSQALKLQYNCGGAFPIHSDSDEAVDSRRITAIFYLNPSWQPGDGGELRLYPFPLSAQPIDIPPANDRLVLFSSTNMPHRVLPSSPGVERCCFTSWLSQSLRSVLSPGQSAAVSHRPAEEMSCGEASEFLLSPRLRKHLVKLLYDKEWQQSLLESHPDSAVRGQVLETHRKEVSLIRERLMPYLVAAGCGQYCQDEQAAFVAASSVASRLTAQTGESIRWL